MPQHRRKKRYRGWVFNVAISAVFVCATSAYAKTEGPNPAKLKLASVHSAVAELHSGELLYTKDAQRPVPVASITKLLTAVVVLDSKAPLDEWLTISERAEQPPIESFTRIRSGSQLQRENLLRIMLMSSENLAAYALADHYSGGYDAFIAAMNAKSKALDMQQSHWVNPSGLSQENRASAADIVKLVRAAADYPEIRSYTQTGFYTAFFRNPRYSLPYGNTNPLVHRSSWDVHLTKTGYLDAAGQCLTMIVAIENEEFVMVFLDSFGRRSPLGDSSRVRRWLKTGSSGRVARAARAYEQRKTRQLQLADNLGQSYIALDAAAREAGKLQHQAAPLAHLIRLSLPLREVYLPLQ